MELLKLARRSSKVTAVFLASTFLFGASVYAGGKDELIKHSEKHKTAYYSHDKLLKMKKDNEIANTAKDIVVNTAFGITGFLHWSISIFEIGAQNCARLLQNLTEDPVERYLAMSRENGFNGVVVEYVYDEAIDDPNWREISCNPQK